MPFKYELHTFKWQETLPNGRCRKCDHNKVYANRTYTPDFWVFGQDGKVKFIIEAKGIFTAKDRKIALAMKEDFPETKFVMIFQADNKISRRKGSSRYSEWASKEGIPFCTEKQMNKTLTEWYHGA